MRAVFVLPRLFFLSCSWVLVESRKDKDLEEVYGLEQFFRCEYLVVEILAGLINKHSIKLAFFLSIDVVSLRGWLSLTAMWIGPTVLCSHAVNNMLRTGQIYREYRIPLEITPCAAFVLHLVLFEFFVSPLTRLFCIVKV
jgi:hypothetical protein